MRGFPSGPEATLLHQKAGYMYATFLWVPVKLFPCNAGRTIYDPALLQSGKLHFREPERVTQSREGGRGHRTAAFRRTLNALSALESRALFLAPYLSTPE